MGEIWVDSDSKAGGYFNLPDETKVSDLMIMMSIHGILGRWGPKGGGVIAWVAWSSGMYCSTVVAGAGDEPCTSLPYFIIVNFCVM